MVGNPPADAGPTGPTEASAIEARLRELGTADRAVNEKAYLKSDLEFTGTTMPLLRATTTAWLREHPDLSRGQLLAVVTALWHRPVHECRQAGVVLLGRRSSLLTAADAGWLEGLIRAARTWALVDGLAANVAGDLARRFPAELGPVLDRWAGDQDFWVRRSALLALLGPLREGGGDFERFSRYADRMLDEKEFFIRKAIGWVLRETAKGRPELVANWIGERTGRASGLTVREAVRRLPPEARERILRAYRAHCPASPASPASSSPRVLLPGSKRHQLIPIFPIRNTYVRVGVIPATPTRTQVLRGCPAAEPRAAGRRDTKLIVSDSAGIRAR